MQKTNWTRVMHIVVCLATMGFVFPNAMMESTEAARELAKSEERAAPAEK